MQDSEPMTNAECGMTNVGPPYPRAEDNSTHNPTLASQRLAELMKRAAEGLQDLARHNAQRKEAA